ncbi:MAG: ABC transporter permease [Ardenticatenaceae bacterium]|nr:ABC transporter permease [Ardenticatenaceae bacterium]HBY94602.1 nitrate ABC transporter permease [Chloroflexota bacterium]
MSQTRPGSRLAAAGLLALPRWANRANQQLRYYLPTIIVFVTVLMGWELAVRVFNIQQFILPKPTTILAAFQARSGELVHIGLFTLREALGGFIIGCSLGILVALATSRWTTAREALMPFAIAANSVPIIAFAPVMNNWFGITNPFSKMMIVAIIVFFPMMINTVRGLTLVDPAALELMRSYAATDFEILWKVRVPNSLPYLFNAFKVASTLSLIGAVVGEFFGGPRAALGVFITQEAAFFRFDNSWAAIIIACALGIAFYLVILLFERMAMPWHASVRGQE